MYWRSIKAISPSAVSRSIPSGSVRISATDNKVETANALFGKADQGAPEGAVMEAVADAQTIPSKLELAGRHSLADDG